MFILLEGSLSHMDIQKMKVSAMMHYGLYSELAGYWEGQRIPWLSEWIQHTAQIPHARYRELAESFDPRDLEPERLVRAFKEFGFSTFCLTAKHHDGFALYPSAYGNFHSERDIVGEFAAACQKYGLPFSLYYSQAQDWAEPQAYTAYRQEEPRDFASYFYGKCLPQVRELLTQYGPIFSIWFDTPDRMPRAYAEELRDTVKSLQPDCLISGRIGYGLGDYRVVADNALPCRPWTEAWEVPVSLGESWGYKEEIEGQKTRRELLETLLKTITRGGHMLLNLGPMGSGKISERDWELFSAFGQYLEAHGEAIFETVPCDVQVYELPGTYWLMSSDRQLLHIHVLEPEKLPESHFDLLALEREAKHVLWRSEALRGQAIQGSFQNMRNLEGESCLRLKIPDLLRDSDLPYTVTVCLEL